MYLLNLRLSFRISPSNSKKCCQGPLWFLFRNVLTIIIDEMLENDKKCCKVDIVRITILPSVIMFL